jgi:chromosomal replication initiation ATPase DnaA
MTRTAERGNLEWIVGKVAEALKVKVEELKTHPPSAAHKDAWKIAAYVAWTIGDRNMVEIGKALGGASHTDALYARGKVEARMASDPIFHLGITKLLDDLRIELF